MRGHNHIREKVQSEESTQLNATEAREQLLYEMRDQMGTVTTEKQPYDDEEKRGDGLVVAKVNGQQVDHYIYYEDDD